MLPDLQTALIGTRFAAHLHHFATIGSTNTALLDAAAAGAPEGTVYFADEQTAGRGRSNHAWHSAGASADAPAEPAGLYLSALIRPSLHLRDALLLSLATGLAAHRAIVQTLGLGLPIDLRWPNDILLGSAKPGSPPSKKIGGILVETAVDPGTDPLLRYAVIGIGLNLNQTDFPPDLAPLATSLRLATGTTVPREPLLIALLRSLDLELTKLESPAPSPPTSPTASPTGTQLDPTPLLLRFTANSTWVTGKRVHVPEQGGYTGLTTGLDSRGFLLVQADDGTTRTVLSGGVREASSSS